MSIGISTRLQEEATVIGELMKRADAAMYRAKNGGKGHAVLYDPDIDKLPEEEAA